MSKRGKRKNQIVIPIGEIRIIKDSNVKEFYEKRKKKMEIKNNQLNDEVPVVQIIQDQETDGPIENSVSVSELQEEKISEPEEKEVVCMAVPKKFLDAADGCPEMTEDERTASLARKINPKYGRCKLCGMPLKKDLTHRKARSDIGKAR